MPRGKAAEVGDTNIARNGYHYTRTEERWELTHHLIAAATLGRPIESDETVTFIDGDRTNLKPDNIKVSKRKTSLRGRIAQLDARILELTLERDRLQAIVDKQAKARDEKQT